MHAVNSPRAGQATQTLLANARMTVWRVLGGFAIAALLAVPLGVMMGAYKPIEAFFEPFVSFARYLPASAFIPLLILWAGIGEAQKLSVIFIGSFFQLVLMIAVSVGNTRRDLVEAAYTLGAADSGIVVRVLLPSAAPEIAETLRMWRWMPGWRQWRSAMKASGPTCHPCIPTRWRPAPPPDRCRWRGSCVTCSRAAHCWRWTRPVVCKTRCPCRCFPASRPSSAQ